MTAIATIEKEIIAYDLMWEELEAHHFGAWVLVHDHQLIGTYETFQKAAVVASKRFGRGPYLIRKIGEGPLTLPSSVLFKKL